MTWNTHVIIIILLLLLHFIIIKCKSWLFQANGEEFYEVYKGVVQEYPSMVTELTSGPCIALEIRAQDAVTSFREMAGPLDPVSYKSKLIIFYTRCLVLRSGHLDKKYFKFILANHYCK